MNTEITTFDKEQFFKKNILPTVKQLVSLCSAYDIPMFFSSCVAEDGKESKYVNEAVTPESHQLKLTKDIFSDLLAVTLGFTTVPPIEKIDMSYDEDN